MDGILIINKPAGITSHDVVDIIRKKFNIRKVGHAGTLDPLATGVLVILLGKATKESDIFMRQSKEYIARCFLGKSTDTQDSTGKVVEEKPINHIDADKLTRALFSFVGEREQVPPMMSAKKIKGKKLYEFARRGESVYRRSVKIRIYDIELLEFALPEFIFRVRCSKGTYIRTLCEDIGKALGYPAHMSALVRTRVGRFTLDKACDLKNVTEKDIIK